MKFVNFCKEKLDESKRLFGTYHYYDKGPDEVMDVKEIVLKLKALPQDQVILGLKGVLKIEHDLDPSRLVSSILGDLDSDPAYDFLFQDPEISEHY